MKWGVLKRRGEVPSHHAFMGHHFRKIWDFLLAARFWKQSTAVCTGADDFGSIARKFSDAICPRLSAVLAAESKHKILGFAFEIGGVHMTS